MHLLKGRRGESNFRIEIFTNNSGGEKDELGGQLEAAPRTRPFCPPELFVNISIRKFDSPRPGLRRAVNQLNY